MILEVDENKILSTLLLHVGFFVYFVYVLRSSIPSLLFEHTQITTLGSKDF